MTSLGLSRRSPIRLRERDWAVRPYAEDPRGGWSGTGRPAVFHPLSGAPAIRDPSCERVGGAVSSPTSPICRVQYTPLARALPAFKGRLHAGYTLGRVLSIGLRFEL